MKTFLTLAIASSLLLVASAASAQFYAPGSHQGWDPATAPILLDDGVAPDAAAGDGIFTGTIVAPTAGNYEFKITDAPDWNNGVWPPDNCWFVTTTDNETVIVTFDTNAYGDGWAPDTYWPMTDHTTGADYKIVGNLQDNMGDPADWDPTGGGLFLHDDGLNGDAVAGDGIYTYCGIIDAIGTGYEWKVVADGGALAWLHQFTTVAPATNGSTWFLDTTVANEPWCFYLDTNTGRIQALLDAPTPVSNSTWGTLKQLY